MNDKDIDTRQLYDVNLREAIARREHRRRPMPADLNERLMQRRETRPSRIRPYRRWLSAAACIVFIIIGIGIVVLPSDRSEQAEDTLAAVTRKAESHKQATERKENGTQPTETTLQKHNDRSKDLHRTQPKAATETPAFPESNRSEGEREESPTLPRTDCGQLVYASAETTKDSTYREPSLVDDFIAKFATSHGVRPVTFDSPEPSETNTVCTVYVFPDRKEVDVFGRLLQTACCYDNATLGYQLYISNLQLLFKMCDRRKTTEYLWLAERVGGNVLLYCSRSPIGSTPSSARYQEFRERFATQAIKTDNYHQL